MKNSNIVTQSNFLLILVLANCCFIKDVESVPNGRNFTDGQWANPTSSDKRIDKRPLKSNYGEQYQPPNQNFGKVEKYGGSNFKDGAHNFNSENYNSKNQHQININLASGQAPTGPWNSASYSYTRYPYGHPGWVQPYGVPQNLHQIDPSYGHGRPIPQYGFPSSQQSQNLKAVDCQWGPWKYGECTKSCGGGTRTNTRDKLVKEQNGGSCHGKAYDILECNSYPCSQAINCQWGPWDLGECTKACGGGTRTNAREKIVREQNGGTCLGNAYEIEQCNTNPCPNTFSSPVRSQRCSSWNGKKCTDADKVNVGRGAGSCNSDNDCPCCSPFCSRHGFCQNNRT